MTPLHARLAGLAAAVVLLGGCAAGTSGTSGTGSTGDSSSAQPTSTPSRTTALTVVIDDGNGTRPSMWTLTCDPPGGTHPHPPAACAQLAAAPGDPFAPTPAGMACNMIYAGPEHARVYGTYAGRHIDATFKRSDGCQTARWNRVSQLLVLRGGIGVQQ